MLDAVKRSLGGKIIIAVTGVLLVFVTLLTLVDMNNETTDILNTYSMNAGTLSSTIEKGLISSMKEGRNEDVQKTLEDVGTQEGIVGVRIFDRKGNILRSSDRGEIGSMVDTETLGLLKEGEGAEVHGGTYSGVYSFIKPIYNAPQCFGCHPPDRRVNGILNVRISMDKAYEDIRRNRWFMVKLALLTILGVALSQALLMRHLVTEPVRKLRGAMKKAERGEEYRLDLKYDDELGELGQAFNGMMKRIADLNAEAIEREKELVRSQETVKSQTLLSAVIDGMPDGVAIIDRDMKLVQVNPRHREIFPQAKVGEPCYFCIHKREQVCPHCGVVKVFEDGRMHDHHSSVTMADGSVKVVHSISAPIMGDGGRIVSAVEVVRDVTDRVSMEKEIKEKGWELERANKKLAKMAVTDGLTLLFNHRYFQDSLKREFKRLARHRALPFLSIAMIDIDNFKDLNDAYGHQAGDRVLRGISKVLKGGVRMTDVVARYGGEEFVIIMPETDIEGTGVVAERVRQSVEAATFTYKDLALNVTVSVGVASYPQENIKSEDDLIKAADRALYQAKSLGKNRVVIANGNPEA